MPTAGKFCTPSSPREHHGFSSFYIVIEPPIDLILSPQVTNINLTGLSLSPSNKSRLARRYEASRMTIITWIPMLSCSLGRLMCGENL